MLSAHFTGERGIQIEEVPSPELRHGEVLIEVQAAGICGSDLHRYRGHDPWSNSPVRPWRGGHEVAGVVVELGPGTHPIDVGQRVTVEPMQLAGCGICVECLRGDSNLCRQRGTSLARRTTTGFAEFDAAAATHLYPIPDHLPFHVAALADVYGCAVHALHRIPVSSADNVMIIGCGPVGLALGQAARLTGAKTIVAGKRDAALAAAMSLGAADFVVNSSQPGLAEKIAEFTGPAGTRVVFEAVGGCSSQTLKLAVSTVSPGGTIGVLGAFTGDVMVSYGDANRKEITLRWCNGYAQWQGQREFGIALNLLAEGRLNAAGLVTHRFPLDRISQAFQAADDKAVSGAIKVTVVPARRRAAYP